MEVYAKVPKDLDESREEDLKYLRDVAREAADRAYSRENNSQEEK